jgi:crotonobetainyl-CoA:carnitine CoA-transferase CaiB-like acyl-CoA transferase
MAGGFLTGVRVLETGESRAVGFAGKLLTDLGAEVWMLETPGRGNRLRRRRPLLPSGVSGLFEFLARGKRSVTVDLDLEDGQELARRFAAVCDGVIADRAVWKRADSGEAFEVRRPFNVVTVSSRGAPHPTEPESEFVDFHEGGVGYMTPGRVEDPEREYPIDMTGGGQASYIGGLYSAIAFLQGLALGRATGETVRNDVSLQASAASMMVLNIPWWEYAGTVPSRLRAAGRPTRSTNGFVRVKDGRVSISMIEEHQWDGLLRVLGAPEWTNLPVFATQLDRGANWDALRVCLEEHFKDTPAQEVMERCQAENVPVFVVRDMDMVLKSEHERARGFFAPSKPDGVLMPSNPWIVDDVPVSSHGRSPAIGEHTVEALRLIGMDDEDHEAFQQMGVV